MQSVILKMKFARCKTENQGKCPRTAMTSPWCWPVCDRHLGLIAGLRAARGKSGGTAARHGAGLLGPAPPPGAARHLAHHADPLPDRVRLSAVQLCGPGRKSGRLQRRSRAADLRGAENPCTIQLRRFDTLLQALAENRADAVIASLAVTPETRQRVDFSDPYYRAPARFVARRDTTLRDVVPEALEGKKVAVVAGTAHEAYLKAFFTEAELQALSQHGGGARSAAQGRGRSSVRRRHSRSPSGSTARTRPAAASSSAARSPKAAISAKASASRSSAATTRCGSPSTGRCSGCGRRAASPICGCGISRSARFEI